MAAGSFAKAKKLGAWSADSKYKDLWDLSKRELIEIALHLAAAATESYDMALVSGDAGDVVRDEHWKLRNGGLI